MLPDPRRPLVLRSDRLGFSVRLDPRSVTVSVAVAVTAAGVFAWSLTVGDFPVPLADVLAHLTGRDTRDAGFIVGTLRLPRGLTALLVGAAFGCSGAILQRLARNPLASPDIIGVNSGAAVAAVFTIVVLHRTSSQVTLAALAGATGTALTIYALAYRNGVTGYRLVLVGIGITAMCSSATSYLLTRAEIFDAQRATVWLTGSLNARSWDHVRPVAVAMGVLVPCAVGLSRQLRLLELGDDAARGLGTRVEAARAGLLLTSVALAAVATAAAGPIAFVALAAPQIARRLTGGGALALVPAALCGALLLTASDLAARRLFAPTELPVGVLTAILGAPYLLYLLARANRVGERG